MKTFIAAIPLFDSRMAVQAYRLSYRNGEKLFGVMDDYRGMGELMLSPGLDVVEMVGIEPFAGELPLFIDVIPYQLLMGAPTELRLEPQQLVCVLEGGMEVDGPVIDRCTRLKELGYRLAVDGAPFAIAGTPLGGLVDYWILDLREPQFDAQLKLLASRFKQLRVVIANIPDMDTFGRLGAIPGALFAGGFYNQPITCGAAPISPLKVNALQLLRQVSEEGFDLVKAAGTIERDPSLSISLLRFINVSSNTARRIESIRSAVAIMGQKEVKRWATVAISLQLAEDKPGEITKLSLVRAKFAENLAGAFELGIFSSSLFMAGLFSLLDVILGKPMDQAIREVSVDERVRQALVDRQGPLYEVLDLIYVYERADWDKVSINMIRNNVKVEAITKAFIDSLVWYRQLLDSIREEEETADAR